jgi:hypothetical protein
LDAFRIVFLPQRTLVLGTRIVCGMLASVTKTIFCTLMLTVFTKIKGKLFSTFALPQTLSLAERLL